MKEFYKEDLAFIHDVGFYAYALESAPGILAILKRHQILEGLIVDLGCGSGLWTKELTKAKYQALGIDISEAMIDIARKQVPEAEFRVESLLKAEIPPCRAVTSISECVSYLFDADNNHKTLKRFFQRVFKALTAGGVFIFDIAEPGQVKQGSVSKWFTEGEGWTVLVEKTEDYQNAKLTRRIITFRQVGKSIRRDDELHHLQLYKAKDVANALQQVGFQVQILRSYGKYKLPKAHAAFVARKPL
jgi:SAM-dependent methyltransferase